MRKNLTFFENLLGTEQCLATSDKRVAGIAIPRRNSQSQQSQSKSQFLKISLLTAMTVSLTACGTITGIPSHGGGKRFAIEQELVSSSARAAVKNMDLSALAGRKVALYVSVIGDQGSGVLTGGRYSIDALIRGEYQNLPRSTTEYNYPTYDTIATTDTSGLTGTTTSTSVLNAPSLARNTQEGANSRMGLGISGGSAGDYKNETLIQNPQDSVFLSRLIQTVLFLRGIEVVPNELADCYLFVNIDVFGTIRSRTEVHIYNNEKLSAETKLEYFAVDKNHNILIKPQSSSYAANYQENYILWTGPLAKSKKVQEADKLLVDFSDISPYRSSSNIGYSEAQSFAPSIGEIPAEEVLRTRGAE